jgi:membrane fusion protein, multidrug efflux system
MISHRPRFRSSPSPRPRGGPPPLAGAALLAALLAAGCGGGETATAPTAPPALPVKVATVTREAMPVRWQGIGTVQSTATVSVVSQINGQITAVHFTEGADVRAGQPLFTIDPRPYQAALQEAQARLSRDRALAENARQDVDRYADLVAKDYVTREQYDSIRANAESLQASAAADEAAVESARLDLGYCTISSPIDGRTGNLLIHRGNVVKANDKPLVVIHQVEPIDVAFSLPQQYLDEVRRRAPGGELKAEVAAPDAGGDPHQGDLAFLDNAVDPETGTIQLKARFPNRDRALWPGQLVDVTLTLAMEADAVVAPAPAVETGQKGDYVFVVGADMTVEQRPVTVSRTVDGKAVVAKGLEPGERVVTDGQLRLSPGARVEIKPDADAGAEEGA